MAASAQPASPSQQDGLRAALIRVVTVLFLGVLPVALLVRVFVVHDGYYGFDFHTFWQAGRDFIHGTSPYPVHAANVIADKENFLYPAWVAAAFAPLGALPYPVAAPIFVVILLAATAGALYLVGVRDWRVYGAVFASAPTFESLNMGTLSPLLMLALAALWRYRDDRRVAVPALAALVASKLFLWPVLLFFMLTRRWLTAVLACVAGIAVTLAAWARFGFAGFGDYSDLLRLVARVEERDSYSVTSLGLALGLPRGVAQLVATLLGVIAIALAVWAARRLRDERLVLVWLLAAALLFSPIVWAHYLILLFVPLALVQPRFTLVWLVIFWMPPDNRGSTAVLIVGFVASAVLVAACLRRPSLRLLPRGAVPRRGPWREASPAPAPRGDEPSPVR